MADVPKRRTATRSTTKRGLENDGSDKDFVATKRPALSSTFSSHINESSLNRQLLTAQSKITELTNALNEKRAEADRLRADRRLLASAEEDERKHRERDATSFSEEKQSLTEELANLRNRMSELESDNDELRDAYDTLSHDSQSSLASLKSDLASQSHANSSLQSQLQSSQTLASSRLETISDLENQVEDLQSQLANTSRISADGVTSPHNRGGGDTAENWEVIREELHRQSSYLRSLEGANGRLTSEVARLRPQAEMGEILREEILALQRKVEGMDELRRKLAELDGQLAVERAKRIDSMHSSASETPGKTPITITKQLGALRSAHALLLDEYGQMKALLAQRESELTNLIEEQDKGAAEIERLKAAVKQANEARARWERDYNLMEREVGFQKALVASYQAEEASREENAEDNDQMDNTTRRSSSVNVLNLERHAAHLEQLVEEYKATNKALERDIEMLNRERGNISGRTQEQWDALVRQVSEVQRSREELQDALSKAEASATRESDKVEELEQTLFELRGEIGAGRHVPPGMRVLSFKQNPAQEWFDTRKEVLERLKNENEALLRRLKELEDAGVRGTGGGANEASGSGNGGGAFVPRESWESLCEEKKELEGVVAQKEKRLVRLQEIFSKKSAEFREAIASIMGLKLAFYPNGQVRVTSQFDLRASFVFQPTSRSRTTQDGEGEGARMQLIGQGEGGPDELGQLMKYWVEQEQCIPGFLASVTLECYEMSKQAR